MTCTICFEPCEEWKFRYRGDIFCRSCFRDHFELLTCMKCGKKKYIHYKTKPHPTCKICLIKDKPCIRCRKPVTRFGKITKDGPVCASCNKYFAEPKTCQTCGTIAKDVWRRTGYGETEPALLCRSCYNKTLPVCIKCKRQKRDCLPDSNNKPVCRLCRGKPRICLQCGQEFPAGRGRICHTCSCTNGLKEKTAFAKGALSQTTAKLFGDFSEYLLKKRGAEFASRRILYFFVFFQELDAFIGGEERFPSFEQILNHFTVAYTRKYLSAMQFFESAGLITRDKKIQDLYADFDMIDRYLETFPKYERSHKIIRDYYHFLYEKCTAGKISVRTVRLSLTPAVKFLQYCRLFNEPEPTQIILDGYLWCIPGQRNTLSGFIRFYNKTYGASLVLFTGKEDSKKIILKSPTVSKKRREQLFIMMMRILKENPHKYSKEEILRTAIEYLHDIKIPDEGVWLSFLTIKQRRGGYFIRFAGRELYLPIQIINSLIY